MNLDEFKIIEKTLDLLRQKGARTLIEICEHLEIKDSLNPQNYFPVQLALLKPESKGTIKYSNGFYFLKSGINNVTLKE